MSQLQHHLVYRERLCDDWIKKWLLDKRMDRETRWRPLRPRLPARSRRRAAGQVSSAAAHKKLILEAKSLGPPGNDEWSTKWQELVHALQQVLQLQQRGREGLITAFDTQLQALRRQRLAIRKYRRMHLPWKLLSQQGASPHLSRVKKAAPLRHPAEAPRMNPPSTQPLIARVDPITEHHPMGYS